MQTKTRKRNLRYFFWSMRSLVSNTKIVVGIFIFVVGIISLFVMRSISFKTKSRAEMYQSPSVAAAYANVDMSENAGRELEENGTLLKSLKVPVGSLANESEGNSVRGEIKSVEQEIGVVIGISKQVVKDHCDGSEESRIIRSDTLRCPIVEDYALRDLKNANDLLQSTGKRYLFSYFDTPWNQAIEQEGACGKASGGQYLPETECSLKNSLNSNSIYIAILYVSNSKESGGQSISSSIRYTAPTAVHEKDGEISIDYWNLGDSTSRSITHELGHSLGQTHTFLMEEYDNEIVPVGFSYLDAIFYDKKLYSNDLNLNSSVDRSVYDWPLIIAKQCYYLAKDPGCHHQTVATGDFIPQAFEIKIESIMGNTLEEPIPNGDYIIFAAEHNYTNTKLLKENILQRGIIKRGKIELQDPQSKMSHKSLLLVIVKSEQEYYRGWVIQSDWQMSHFMNRMVLPIKMMHEYREDVINKLGTYFIDAPTELL